MSIQLPEKLGFLIEQPARYKVMWGGRGAAKSWGVARALLAMGFEQQLRILCAREVQRTIADSVHRLLSDQIVAMGLEGFYTIQEASISGANGTEFLFAGLRTQDVAKIKSFEGVDICWVEEAQAVSAKSWAILVPTIRKEGSEIWVTFNPDMDSDETYQRFVVKPPPDAVVVKMTYRDNPWFPAVLEKERLHLKQIDPDGYEHVWEGKCKTVVEGAIYANEVRQMVEDGRIRPVPYDPMLKVHAIWDLGWNDQMSIILVQRSASEVRILDYIEDSQRILADYVSDLQQRRYVWGTDWLPHDGAAKDFKTGKSTQEILKKLGRRVRIVPQIGVEQGIIAARMMFPRVYADDTKAKRLVDCLRRYRRGIPESTGEPGKPVHDEYSHGADAFRYLAVVAERLVNENDGPSATMKPFRPAVPGVM